ncbi:hypothetical protein KI387_019455, partial [Taxus chinensis]
GRSDVFISLSLNPLSENTAEARHTHESQQKSTPISPSSTPAAQEGRQVIARQRQESTDAMTEKVRVAGTGTELRKRDKETLKH